MRRAALTHATALAEHAVRETGLGRMPDKVQKNLFAAEKTPGVEDIVSVSWSGDGGLTIVERAPWGVIGSITPITNPTSTIINNSIYLVAGGNAVVYNFHPGAKRLLCSRGGDSERAIESVGGPRSLSSAVSRTRRSKARRR